jgi:hypothetical protein
MRRSLIAGFVASALLVAMPLFAQSKAKAQNVPEIPMTSVPNFFKLPPDLYFGEGIGIATNSKGHVFVYTRSGDTRLFEFDQNGNYVREIGQGVYGLEFAHAVRVDREDNIWTVDEGTNMVIKFNPEGRVVMVLGRRPESVAGAFDSTQPASPPEKYRFGRPTDVTWDAQGNIFISDGYVNSRVVKYDKNGRFLKTVGTRGSEPSQMNTPHSITSDAQGNIYVADRGNARAGVRQRPQPEDHLRHRRQPVGDLHLAGADAVSVRLELQPDANPAASWAITGEIYKMELDGRISASSAKGKGLGEFSTVHEIDCRNPNELFVSEISAWRAQKIILNPKQAPTTASAAIE